MGNGMDYARNIDRVLVVKGCTGNREEEEDRNSKTTK
jgi:hypothetical protein